MKSLRIRECLLDGVLRTVIDTPVPLSEWQRQKVREYAGKQYRSRIKQMRGWKRSGMERILSELDNNTFLERPVPLNDFEHDCVLMGR